MAPMLKTCASQILSVNECFEPILLNLYLWWVKEEGFIIASPHPM